MFTLFTCSSTRIRICCLGALVIGHDNTCLSKPWQFKVNVMWTAKTLNIYCWLLLSWYSAFFCPVTALLCTTHSDRLSLVLSKNYDAFLLSKPIKLVSMTIKIFFFVDFLSFTRWHIKSSNNFMRLFWGHRKMSIFAYFQGGPKILKLCLRNIWMVPYISRNLKFSPPAFFT